MNGRNAGKIMLSKLVKSLSPQEISLLRVLLDLEKKSTGSFVGDKNPSEEKVAAIHQMMDDYPILGIRKIHGIKCIREGFQLGLKIAKQLWEDHFEKSFVLYQSHNPTFRPSKEESLRYFTSWSDPVAIIFADTPEGVFLCENEDNEKFVALDTYHSISVGDFLVPNDRNDPNLVYEVLDSGFRKERR